MSKQISEGMRRHWKAKKESSTDALYQEVIASQKAHIADLQKEVKRLENLVQVLSDDKFFKPQVVERPPSARGNRNGFSVKRFRFSDHK